MKREATATAATIEEAISAARAELCVSDDTEVEIEIVDQPEKKILGLFGGKQAKVTVSFDDGKPAPKPEKKPASKSAPKPEKKAEKKPETPKSDKPAQPKATPAAKPAPVKNDAPKSDKPAPKQNNKAAKSDRAAKPVEINKQALDTTLAFVKDILDHMNVGEFTLSVSDVEGGFCIDLEGDGLGAVIGRRGETLDALQYLASLCYNNDEDGFVRVVLDSNDYRSKREQTLIGLAGRVASQSLRTGHNQSLEPMNPYERRIIHTAVQDIEGVTSWSVSDGRNRRVIIGAANDDGSPVNPDDHPYRSANERGGRGGRSDRNDRGRGGRGRGPRGPRRDSAAKSDAPTREKHSDATDLPLFGRIDK